MVFHEYIGTPGGIETWAMACTSRPLKELIYKYTDVEVIAKGKKKLRFPRVYLFFFGGPSIWKS